MYLFIRSRYLSKAVGPAARRNWVQDIRQLASASGNVSDEKESNQPTQEGWRYMALVGEWMREAGGRRQEAGGRR
jgi:hypothetical protein